MIGKGKTFVTKEGKLFYFCSSKCENNFKLKRDPKKRKWIKKQKKAKPAQQ